MSSNSCAVLIQSGVPRSNCTTLSFQCACRFDAITTLDDEWLKHPGLFGNPFDKKSSSAAISGSSHFGSNQGGNRITVEVLFTGFLFACDVDMSGLWHGQSRLPTEVHRSGLSASRWTSVGLGQSQGYEELQSHAYVGVFGQSTVDVSRLFPPALRGARLLPQLQSHHHLWGMAVALLQGSRLSERLSEITSRRSAKGCVAATLSARRRWRSMMRVQPRPRSKIA